MIHQAAASASDWPNADDIDAATAVELRGGAQRAATAEPAPTEDELARSFTERHADDLRYCAGLGGKWLEYRSTHWELDTTLHAFDLARDVCREAAAQVENVSKRAALVRAQTVAAVVKFAQAARQHATVPEQFDADDFALNTPTGTIDLRTGELRPHRAAEYCTKITAVGPRGSRPRWTELLKFVTGGDTEYAEFLQRFFGYCLTGDTREEAMVFGYGSGGNGKGTVVNTINAILGTYACVAPMEAFVAGADRHPTELAMLRGARLVTAQETQEGRAWNEARLKALTGRDPISARFMRGDFFTFVPKFKLLIFGNHRPPLRVVDDAVRRRFFLAPFTQKVECPDVGLKDALREEWGGILQWMVDGCQLWLESGLKPPTRVLDSTREYFAAEDSVQQWLDDQCTVVPPAERSTWVARPPWAASKDLFASWQRFELDAGVHERHRMTQHRFSEMLSGRGFPRANGGQKGNARGFHWIELQPPQLLRESSNGR